MTTPPYGPPVEEKTYPRPKHVGVTLVLGALAVLATLVVGATITARDAAAGRALEAGECTVAASPCVERATVVVTKVSYRRSHTTWSSDTGLRFGTDSTETSDARLRDGKRIIVLTYDDEVVALVRRDGVVVKLSDSGFVGATLDALATTAVLVLIAGALLMFLVPRVSPDRAAYVVVGGLGGPVAGAVSASLEKPLTTTVLVTAVAMIIGTGIGASIRVRKPTRWFS